MVETMNLLQHDVRPILNFRPITFARLQALSSDAHLCTILEDIRRKKVTVPTCTSPKLNDEINISEKKYKSKVKYIAHFLTAE